ncbi:MAG: oxidoreductase [Gammaproteobacteria bacterium]|nr:oxidoreductase [Gammaproteobacteria bacterium]
MTRTFDAFRIHEHNGRIESGLEQLTLDDLGDGDVVIAVSHSSINYKDALAATGKGKILRRYPLVGGIDLAGQVERSDDPRYQPGDPVLVTGCGLSETHDGGYARYARVPGDWVIPMPAGLDAWRAMCIGTAGFTAALAIHRMEHNHLAPDRGPVVVTGATGGVGSLAIDMLAGRGYSVAAVTGKREQADYLRAIGAAEVLLRDELDYGKRPLERARWAGAVDNVGGEMLTWLTRSMNFWGSIASIGLAASADLNTTVLPFILRGINLLGVNSSATPREWRLAVWERIASDLQPQHLDRIGNRTVELAQLPEVFDEYMKGQVTGRTVVILPGN